MEFACSPCTYMGSLQVLQLTPTVQGHVCLSVSDAKLTIGVNGYAYRYDNPVSTVKPAYRLHPHYSELDKQQIKLMYR